jgi:hypothetical protein
MELLLGAAIVVVIWFFWNRSRASSPVAQSALRSLLELDAIGIAKWSKLEEAISRAAEPAETCRAILEGRRKELPEEINDLWTKLDDLAARVNQRAEHYERVSRQPAPPLPGRAASDRIMARVRLMADE